MISEDSRYLEVQIVVTTQLRTRRILILAEKTQNLLEIRKLYFDIVTIKTQNQFSVVKLCVQKMKWKICAVNLRKFPFTKEFQTSSYSTINNDYSSKKRKPLKEMEIFCG